MKDAIPSFWSVLSVVVFEYFFWSGFDVTSIGRTYIPVAKRIGHGILRNIDLTYPSPSSSPLFSNRTGVDTSKNAVMPNKMQSMTPSPKLAFSIGHNL